MARMGHVDGGQSEQEWRRGEAEKGAMGVEGSRARDGGHPAI